MADAKQLEILNQGVLSWNRWREENPDTRIDLAGSNLSGMDLDGVDFSNALLSGSNLSRASLKRANLAKAELAHANLTRANLASANLAFCALEDAILPYARLRKANLSGANLSGICAEDSDFHFADLSYTSLKKAVLSFSNFRYARLVGADLEGANFSSINLDHADVSLVRYDHGVFLRTLRDTRCRLPALWDRRFDLILDTTMRCLGNHTASCFGSQRFRLFLQDQDYLEEMLCTAWGAFWCFIWWASANCGRSLIRWAAWSVLIALVFAVIYWCMGPDCFATSHLRFGFLNLLYYSIVTFTTLGFGDIAPQTTTAAFVVSIEVILGYIMLGGLISIFSGKLSRRSG